MGDGWTNSTFGPANQFSPRVTAQGTYTYTLTCFAGPIQVSASVTISVENDAPYTTASVNPTTVVFSDSPADYLSIGWKTNLSSCVVNSNPNTLDGESTTYPLLPSGASDAEDVATYSPRVPGTYVITVTCTKEIGPQDATAAAPITVNVLPPPPPTVTISSSPSTVVQDQNFTLTWSSTNAKNCTSTGDGSLIGVVWDGALAPNGSQVEGAMFGGKATLGITCQSIDPNQGSVSAQTAITVTGLGPQPTVTLSVSPVSVAAGQTFTLTWSSTNATSCFPNGGGAGETGWTGILATSGSLAQIASVEGVFTYTLTCSSAAGTNVQSQATLTVTAASTVTPPIASSGKSGGGGGKIEIRDLILLTVLLGLTCMRRKSRQSPTRDSRKVFR